MAISTCDAQQPFLHAAAHPSVQCALALSTCSSLLLHATCDSHFYTQPVVAILTCNMLQPLQYATAILTCNSHCCVQHTTAMCTFDKRSLTAGCTSDYSAEIVQMALCQQDHKQCTHAGHVKTSPQCCCKLTSMHTCALSTE